VVIDQHDEQEISDEGEMHLALDIDLPKTVEIGGFKAIEEGQFGLLRVQEWRDPGNQRGISLPLDSSPGSVHG